MLLSLMPHGYCFLWNVPLTLLHVVSDGAIAIAYLSIPVLMLVNRRRVTDTIRRLVILFALFILACGVGHLLSAWNIWHGNYWLEGTWKVLTAGISLFTAWELQNILPMMMDAPGKLLLNETLARTDLLTGLANRRGLETAYTIAQARPLEANTHPAIFMLIDLDHFKTMNDTRGHVFGDEVLRQVGTVLAHHTRAVDTVARIGGDEFAVLLPGCSLDQGQQIAERIRQAIADLRLDAEAQPSLTTTASIGLALLATPCPFATAYRHADKALYTSKHSGRNCVSVGPAIPSEAPLTSEALG